MSERLFRFAVQAKKCPFCGYSEPAVIRTPEDHADVKFALMCGYAECAARSGWADSEANALRKWNRRKLGMRVPQLEAA